MNGRLNYRYVIDSLFLISATIVLAVTLYAQHRLSREIEIRNSAADITEDRLTKLEAHFVGHTVILAKDGKGISIVPCRLNLDKNCHRDDTGIRISDMTIVRWN